MQLTFILEQMFPFILQTGRLSSYKCRSNKNKHVDSIYSRQKAKTIKGEVGSNRSFASLKCHHQNQNIESLISLKL